MPFPDLERWSVAQVEDFRHTNHNGLQVNGSQPGRDQSGILIVHFGGEDRDVTTLASFVSGFPG